MVRRLRVSRLTRDLAAHARDGFIVSEFTESEQSEARALSLVPSIAIAPAYYYNEDLSCEIGVRKDFLLGFLRFWAPSPTLGVYSRSLVFLGRVMESGQGHSGT